MKAAFLFVVVSALLLSCGSKPETAVASTKQASIAGTWKLLTGTLIEKNDTTITDYTKNTSFIKIINDTHFAFMQHDLTKGKDSAVFSAGGGRYTFNDSSYTEHLEYCSARDWENNDFTFTVTMSGDTLIQKGIEKVEGAGVNRYNIEKYIRMAK